MKPYKSILIITNLILNEEGTALELDVPFKIYGQNIIMLGEDITYRLHDLSNIGNEVIAKVDYRQTDNPGTWVNDESVEAEGFSGNMGQDWGLIKKDSRYSTHYGVSEKFTEWDNEPLGYTTLFGEDFSTTVDILDSFDESGNSGIMDIGNYKGRNSMKAYLNRSIHSNPYRTEITLKNGATTYGTKLIYFEKIYSISFNIYFDDGFVQDETREIFFQLHGVPDDGEMFRNPNIGFVLDGDGILTEYVIRLKGDTKSLTPDSGPDRYSYSESFNLGEMDGDIGKWVNWKIEMLYTYSSQGGYVKVFKDDALLLDKQNVETAFNDDKGGYFKFGVYKWPWNTDDPGYVAGSTGASERIQYYSNIDIKMRNS